MLLTDNAYFVFELLTCSSFILILFVSLASVHLVLVAVGEIEPDLAATVCRNKRTACTVSEGLIQIYGVYVCEVTR